MPVADEADGLPPESEGGGLQNLLLDLTTEVAARSEEIEARREIPPEVAALLERAGCFRTLVPRAFGGLEMDAVDVVEMLEALARADSSVGWVTMVRTAAPLLLARFPRGTFEMVYRAGPDVNVRGSVAPKGVAVVENGGFRVNGQWPFASGVSGPGWFVGTCLVMGADGAPRVGPGGVPEMRLALIPADDVEYLDTWNSVGLCGTASQDVRAIDVRVADERTTPLIGAAVCVDGPAFGMSFRDFVASHQRPLPSVSPRERSTIL